VKDEAVDWDALVAEQVDYYRVRAQEYDDCWTREREHDFGEEFNRKWFADIDELRMWLSDLAPLGDVLELAAGTGMWTVELAAHADRVTAVDASDETLALCREKLAASAIATPVEYVVAEMFSWEPDRQYDTVSFSLWLTHVPPPRFEPFWELVDRALKPGGRFVLVDNAFPRQERAPNIEGMRWDGDEVEWALGHTRINLGISRRKLTDGRQFDIVKVFWRPEELRGRLADLGWDASIGETSNGAFIIGHGRRADR
jgi:demethylmenaquinone methyltransferase/2-methoxy-6-polyprenyl-1,4-benzoquinol methylase